MKTREDANVARHALHGKYMGNRYIEVTQDLEAQFLTTERFTALPSAHKQVHLANTLTKLGFL